MSYGIRLYQRSFLRRAIDEDLGDWGDAEPIPDGILELVHDRLAAQGYTVENDGATCREYIHPNSTWGLQVSMFRGEIAFAIPYWGDADNAIAPARKDAKELAKVTGLGYYDQQTGEVEA